MKNELKPDPLDFLLREKIELEKPRPGFETRIQALAREPRKKSSGRWLRYALPVLGVFVILLMLSPKNQNQPQNEIVEEQPAEAAPTVPSEAIAKNTEETATTPMHQEIEGIKHDARRTFSIFRKALPSIPNR